MKNILIKTFRAPFKISYLIYKISTHLKFWLYSIEYINIKYSHGPLIVLKKKGSHITIGKNFRFNSLQRSNPVGLNRYCQITTLTDNACLRIGENFGMSGTVISCFKNIKIGNNVLCGGNVTIMDSDWHSIDPKKRHVSGEFNSEEIIIEDNVWLGYNVTVCKGVTIGENSVIGVGSIVTKNIPKNSVAAGIPCEVIKTI